MVLVFRTNGSISVDDIYEKLSSIFDKYLSKHSLLKLNIPTIKRKYHNHSKSDLIVSLYMALLREHLISVLVAHNTGTKIPKGSKALAGIGCHFMAQWMDRDTLASLKWEAKVQVGLENQIL